MKKISLPKISLKKNGRWFGFGSDPDADWKVIFSSSVILLVVILLVCFYISTSIISGDAFSEPAPDAAASIDGSRLHGTAQYYSGKAANFKNIQITPETGQDPSI